MINGFKATQIFNESKKQRQQPGLQATQSEVAASRKMIPFHNVFWLRKIFDEVEHSLGEFLGVKYKEGK